MSFIERLQKLIVSYLLNNRIPLILDFYLIDFQKIGNIFTFLKTVYLVFFQKLDMILFYEFIQYALHELYAYTFVEYLYSEHNKTQIPDCLKFELTQFDFYLFIQQKSDGKLSINTEFSLKLNTVHQGKERRYVVSRLINKGSYGKVYLCVDEHGNQFAMKLFQFKEEMDIELKALRHLETLDGIIQSLDSFDFSILDIKFGAFVMPFMEYTLKSFVEKYNLPDNFLLRVFYGLLCDLIKIHKMGCFHLDMKPENILISDKNNKMKLADFGLSDFLPKETHYATTQEAKITSWFRCPVNALAEANGTHFHISWIADFFALCVSMIYMSSYDKKLGKFGFVHKPTFDIFTRQQYFKSNRSDKSPKEIDVDLSKVRINIACRAAIDNIFLRDILMEYMNPESVLRWYSELQTSPKNNSVIPEVIAKIKTYFRMKSVVSELNSRFKKSESDIETPPRPHQCAHVESP
jgi:serine/threonine protein kinase